MLKLNKTFYMGGPGSDVFEDRITPPAERREHLMKCKNKIRDHLKPLIREATKSVLGMDRTVEPRFRTQGSWLYNTCVVPAHQPPQEMDWDYGVYLPVTVWEDNGPPSKMAKAYFELVEGLLKSLCQKERWELLPGKSTCIRVKVAPWAHIDVPLYAAPEKEFEKIRERIALEEAMHKKAFDSAQASYAEEAMKEQQWEDLDHVVLATRQGEWMSSDPEIVAKWYRDRVKEHGEQLRRVCRYLKAWRDFHWEKGGPTSVSIMIATVQGFEAKSGRDDLAMEHVAAHLTNAFLKDLFEPGIDNGAEDFNRLDADERQIASARFRDLRAQLHYARSLGAHQKDQALFTLKKLFGSRMPADSSLVDTDGDINAVRAAVPTRVPAPVVPSTKAG
jgi:hypothetical protein